MKCFTCHKSLFINRIGQYEHIPEDDCGSPGPLPPDGRPCGFQMAKEHNEMMTAMELRGTKPEDIATTGVKFDANKIQLELLSALWINGVGQVLTFGAKKYAAHNWRKGIKISRLIGACLRHIFAFLRGEDLDPETGLSHLHHASCPHVCVRVDGNKS